MDNRARRAVVPVLATVMLLSTAAPAFALSTNEIGALTYGSQQVEIIQTVPISDDLVFLAKGPDEQGTPDWTDWKPGPWWYGRPSAIYSWQKLYVKGIPNGDGTTRFGGDQLITTDEFLTLLVRSSVSEADQAKYIAEAKAEWIVGEQTDDTLAGRAVRSEAELGALWDKGEIGNTSGRTWAYVTAVIPATRSGILDGVSYSKDIAESPCPRGVMAQLIANTLKIRGEDTSKVDTTTAIGYMSDAQAIKASPNKNAIGIAIGSGIVSGVGGNKFNLSGTMDRASACEVMLRLDNPNGERANVLKDLQATSNGSTTPSDDRLPNRPNVTDPGTNTQPITIDMRDKSNMHRAPREGDTVIRLDGTQVVLARDPVSGVLGAYQNVGPYLQTLCLDGRPVIDNDITFGAEAGWSDSLASGRYMQAGIKGWESTWLWTNEWAALKEASSPNRAGISGTEGQIDSTGLWRVGASGNWQWQGPVDC